LVHIAHYTNPNYTDHHQVNIHWIHCIENILTVKDFWATCACPAKQSSPKIFHCIEYISYHSGFEQLCACPENEFALKISLYWIYFLHSGFLSSLRLPWKAQSALKSLYWIYIFYSDVRWGSWLGRHCLFQSQICEYMNWMEYHNFTIQLAACRMTFAYAFCPIS